MNPKSDNGRLADGTLPLSIGDSTRPTIALEYFVRDRVGIDLLAPRGSATISTSPGSDRSAAPNFCRQH